MRRRAFIATGAAALALSTIAHAQQRGRTYRIVVWHTAEPISNLMSDGTPRYRAFFAELTSLGFIEGRNLLVQRLTSAGQADRFLPMAREVVNSRPDVIVVNGNALAQPLMTVTADIPIVVGSAGDPVSSGLVASLARPGGNITGFTIDAGIGLWGLLLELLRDVTPHSKSFGFIERSDFEVRGQRPISMRVPTLEAAAKKLNIDLSVVHFDQTVDEPNLRVTFRRMMQAGIDALLVTNHGAFLAQHQLVVRLAAEYRLPACYAFSEYSEAGGLMSYGPDLVDNYRKAASYVARILNGERPSDLPVQQPTRFKFVVNAKTAKALGIEIPFLVLARADEVIE